MEGEGGERISSNTVSCNTVAAERKSFCQYMLLLTQVNVASFVCAKSSILLPAVAVHCAALTDVVFCMIY
jgi:hypothetical protein